MARHGRTVLWGGRPGVDRQFGGPYDMLRTSLARDYATLTHRVRVTILPPGLTITRQDDSKR